MSFKTQFWRATVGRFFRWVDSIVEQKYTRESFRHPIVRRTGREALMYYEDGRSTTITCDLALGRNDLDLLVYWKAPLRWRGTKELLTPEESERVYSKLPSLLDAKKIRWAYSETVRQT
jgi:hypothetical protein